MCVCTFISIRMCKCMPQNACGCQRPMPFTLSEAGSVCSPWHSPDLPASFQGFFCPHLSDMHALCLALHRFWGFIRWYSWNRCMCVTSGAISSVPKAVLLSHSCFTIKMSGMACSKPPPILIYFLSCLQRGLSIHVLHNTTSQTAMMGESINSKH